MNQRSVIILALLVGLFLFISFSSEAIDLGNPSKKQRGDVSDGDKAQVIKMMLERVIDLQKGEFDEVNQDNKIILSTENIRGEMDRGIHLRWNFLILQELRGNPLHSSFGAEEVV